MGVFNGSVYEGSMMPAQHCEGAWTGRRHMARRQGNPFSSDKLNSANRALPPSRVGLPC